LVDLEINQLTALGAKPADDDVFPLDDITALPLGTRKVRFDELGFLELTGGTMTGAITMGTNFIDFQEISPTPANPAAEVARLYSIDINAQTQLAFLNSGGIESIIQRSSARVVAANDATAQSLAMADQVTTGAADEVEINSAFGNIIGGGDLKITDGTFTIAASVLNSTVSLMSGQGYGSIVFPANATNLGATLSITGSKSQVSIKDFTIDGNRANQTSGNGRGIQSGGSGTIFDFHDLQIKETFGPAIYVARGVTADVDVISYGNLLTGIGETGIHYQTFDRAISALNIINDPAQETTNADGITYRTVKDGVIGLSVIEMGATNVLGAFGVSITQTSENIAACGLAFRNNDDDAFVVNSSTVVAASAITVIGGTGPSVTTSSAGNFVAYGTVVAKDITGAGILSSVNSRDNVFTGVIVENASLDGIQISSVNPDLSRRVVVSGFISGNNTDFGFDVAGDVEDYIITEDNVISVVVLSLKRKSSLASMLKSPSPVPIRSHDANCAFVNLAVPAAAGVAPKSICPPEFASVIIALVPSWWKWVLAVKGRLP